MYNIQRKNLKTLFIINLIVAPAVYNDDLKWNWSL